MRRRIPPGMAAILVMLPTILLMAGCTKKMSNEERQKVAVAYAEMLIVKNMQRADSVDAAKAADSVVRHYGFSGEAELMSTIKEMGHDPESLRVMLDSAQKRLERVQQGVDPDLPPKKPASAIPPKK